MMINDKVANELVDALLREIIVNIHINKAKIKLVEMRSRSKRAQRFFN